MLLAIAPFPMVALMTLVAVVIADGVAWLLGLGAESVREGGYACVAVLTTLATASTMGVERGEFIVVGAVLAVFYTASFQAVFARLALPTHSLPLVAAAWTAAELAR